MCQKMRGIVGLGVLAILMVPGTASAQLLGVGPHFSLVRGDLVTNTPTTRFMGGTARLKLTGNLSVEGALDYRTTWSLDRTQRVREAPLQGSVLLYPIHAVLAPYALGGLGVYTRNYDVMAAGVVTDTAQERKIGAHVGFGAEARLGKHAVAYMDYRYRFVKFGNDTASTSTTGLVDKQSAVGKLLALVPGLGQLNVSHQGSMWTGGVAFVF